MKDNKITTKGIILKNALKMINEIGISNLRLESIAQASYLNSSNVTYYYKKKEDLCIELWRSFIEETENISKLITRTMDIKQAYLIIRALSMLMYQYRGMVSYTGMISFFKKEYRQDYSLIVKISEIYDNIFALLLQNNYIRNDISERERHLTQEQFIIGCRYWLNREYIFSRNNVGERVDYNALVVLYTLYGILSKEGRKEFEAVKKCIGDNTIRDARPAKP